MIGQTISHYQVTGKLGAGGMGEVYRAKDARLDREVAIKVLPTDFAKDADRLRRFEQEARATSALNHPNILTIYDIGTHDGAPYIVSELLEGAELRAYLNEGALATRKAIDYAQQITQGLAAAHDKGIVLVAAAGNAGPKSPPLYPAADPNVIAVTATDQNDRIFAGAGCNRTNKAKAKIEKGNGTAVTAQAGWWCQEHGIPEEICGLCNKAYRDKKKAEGDWCEEHRRLKSHHRGNGGRSSIERPTESAERNHRHPDGTLHVDDGFPEAEAAMSGGARQ